MALQMAPRVWSGMQHLSLVGFHQKQLCNFNQTFGVSRATHDRSHYCNKLVMANTYSACYRHAPEVFILLSFLISLPHFPH